MVTADPDKWLPDTEAPSRDSIFHDARLGMVRDSIFQTQHSAQRAQEEDRPPLIEQQWAILKGTQRPQSDGSVVHEARHPETGRMIRVVRNPRTNQTPTAHYVDDIPSNEQMAAADKTASAKASAAKTNSDAAKKAQRLKARARGIAADPKRNQEGQSPKPQKGKKGKK